MCIFLFTHPFFSTFPHDTEIIHFHRMTNFSTLPKRRRAMTSTMAVAVPLVIHPSLIEVVQQENGQEKIVMKMQFWTKKFWGTAQFLTFYFTLFFGVQRIFFDFF